MLIEGMMKDVDFVEEDKPQEPGTFDEVHSLAVQSISLLVQISQFGGEDHAVTLDMGTDYDNLLSIYCKNKNIELSRKLKAAHETLMAAFIDK